MRDGRGRMSPVTAFSYRGALRIWLQTPLGKQSKRGDFISIKPRGHGEWQDYKVS